MTGARFAGFRAAPDGLTPGRGWWDAHAAEYLAEHALLDPGVHPRVRALAPEDGLARDVTPEPLVEVVA